MRTLEMAIADRGFWYCWLFCVIVAHWLNMYTLLSDPQLSGCDHMTGRILIMIDWIDETEHRHWISVFG